MGGKRLDRKQLEQEKPSSRKRSSGQRIKPAAGPTIDAHPGQSLSDHSTLLSRVQSDGERQALMTSLQQTHGNAYVQRLVGSLTIQAKMTVNPPGDKYEQEADHVADLVTAAPVTQRQEVPEEEEIQTKVQRQGIPEEEELLQGKLQRQGIPEEEEPIQGKLQRQEVPEEEEIQTKLQRQEVPEEEEIQTKLQRQAETGVPEVTEDIEKRIAAQKGQGQALDVPARTSLESGFGLDFSQVRVHTGAEANQLSRELSAEAFTTGKDIFFKEGSYQPNTEQGRKLVAHELTHVVQQTEASPAVQRNVPSDIEVEGSMSRAGVRPDFPPIWATLMEQADAASYMSYERWQRVTQDASQAEALFGQGLNLAWGQVRNQFLIVLIGSAATAVVSNLLRIIPQIDEALDEASWERDRDYRRMRIYAWLLKQLAITCASAERGFQVEGWDSGVQQIFDMLVSQTVNYQDWMESDDAREFRMRAAEAQGPAGRYGGYYAR